jgi:hypothetical protein
MDHHLGEGFLEDGEAELVFDLQAVFHLFDTADTGLIDYSQFLIFAAKHTAGSEDEKLRFTFFNAEPRGQLSMDIEGTLSLLIAPISLPPLLPPPRTTAPRSFTHILITHNIPPPHMYTP